MAVDESCLQLYRRNLIEKTKEVIGRKQRRWMSNRRAGILLATAEHPPAAPVVEAKVVADKHLTLAVTPAGSPRTFEEKIITFQITRIVPVKTIRPCYRVLREKVLWIVPAIARVPCGLGITLNSSPSPTSVSRLWPTYNFSQAGCCAAQQTNGSRPCERPQRRQPVP